MIRIRPVEGLPRQGITPVQADVLKVVRAFIKKNSYSPTMQEIADSMSRSHRSVERAIEGLESRGRLTRKVKTPRSIALVE